MKNYYLRLLSVLIYSLLLLGEISAFDVHQSDGTLTFKEGTTLEEIIQKIRAESKTRFTYPADITKDLKLEKDIEIETENLQTSFGHVLKQWNLLLVSVSPSHFIITGGETPDSSSREVIKVTPREAISIQGRVTDIEGNPLIGVNVVEKKNPSNGSITDIDGNYRLEVDDENSVLIFSYVGFKKTELTVGSSSSHDVVMFVNPSMMDEIVVTGFGIEKQEKLLTSNVQSVAAEELVLGRPENVVSALQGKVSGLQITSTSGAPGAPTEIILRGATSVDGNNQPLFVVDGIAISNATDGGTTNRAADINPEDIASITVLKGASAAALYGIDAANGAIIITTKSGKAGKMKVGLSSYYGLSNVANLHGQQDFFTTGYSGTYNGQTFSHWGPKYRKSDKVYDNVHDFFETGQIFKADLNVSGGSDNTTYYISGSTLQDKGIVPNTDYQKNSVLLKVNTALSDRLNAGISMNAITTGNRYGIVEASGGWLSTVYRWPRWDEMKDFLNADGSERNIWTPVSGDLSTVPDNPWWTAYHKVRNDKMDRLIGSIHLTYNVTDWFDLDYRIGRDNYSQHYKSVREWGSYGSSYEGAISEFDRKSDRWTSTLLAKFNRKVNDDITMDLVLGHNVQTTYALRSSISGSQFRNPDLFSINNLKDVTNSQYTARRRLIGVFGDFRIDYKSMLILGLTGRNDWSSTLPTKNRSFFYPSVSVGFIFTELLSTDAQNLLSFGKIRASYASVGKDAPPHKLDQTLSQYFGLGQGWKNGAFAGNPALKPELTRELELGLDLRFWNGKVGLDLTYYNRKSTDQIITPRVTPVTGAILQTVNSGSVENKGYEISLVLNPISQPNLDWNVTLNTFGNRSKLASLFGDLVEFPVTYGQVSSIAIASSRLDQPLFGIIGTDYMRNDAGEVIVDTEGYPLINSEKNYIGNREPKNWYGLINDFKIGRNFNFAFQLDGALGVDILNATGANLIQNGLHEMLEKYRRKEFIFDGVVENDNGSYTQNQTPIILDRNYFANNYGIVGSNFVEKVDWMRLRSVEFSYMLSPQTIKNLRMSQMSFTLSLSNLFLLTNYSGGDPQVNNAGPNGGGASGAGTMGVDYFQVPERRSYSIGLSVKF